MNVPVTDVPTAKQREALGHATDERPPLGGPAGLGLVVTDHPVAAPDGAADNTKPATIEPVATAAANITKPNCRKRPVTHFIASPRILREPFRRNDMDNHPEHNNTCMRA